MVLWMAAAFAGGTGGVAAPGPVEPGRMVDAGITGLTWMGPQGGISGARFGVGVRRDRLHLGGEVFAMDDPYASDHWDVHAASFWLGYDVVPAERIQIVPFARIGSHLQVGVAARLGVDFAVGSLELDASGGPSVHASALGLKVMPAPEPFAGFTAEPGAFEAGARFTLGVGVRPSLRLGVFGDHGIASVRIGGRLYLEGSVAHALDPTRARGFGALRVGARL